MKIFEFFHQNIHYCGFMDHESVREIRVINDNRDWYSILSDCINQQLSLREFIFLNKKTSFNIKKLSKEIIFTVPLKPKNNLTALVTGVGITHIKRLAKRYQSSYPLQPEWFYKGNGSILRTTHQALELSVHAYSAAEEAEIVVVYIIDDRGKPHRVGYTIGNDFSDPEMRKQGSTYFGQSKLCMCSIAPEIILAPLPVQLNGNIKIYNDKATVWTSCFVTGTSHLYYSLSEIENLLFQHEQFRQPEVVHYLFIGADRTSHEEDIHIHVGDYIKIDAPGFSFDLVNQVAAESKAKILSYTVNDRLSTELSEVK